ncbi:MAG: FG-GAP repeat protein, partial [Chloroflexi bacterium]|nr:FG-GAP repeat protein [Chloroflexota bacterium]
ASDAEADDEFGYAVAVSGDTTVVGARVEDAGGNFAGAAYVFQRDEGGADNWGEVTKLTASDATAGDFFGFSVAVSGDTAVVGAHGEDTGGTFAGAAYVFERGEGGADNWGQVEKLTASDPETLDQFGVSVAVSGDTAVVGAIQGDAGDSNTGSAYVFQRNEGGTDNWGQVKKLTASDAEAYDEFGWSVAASADTVVVGAIAERAGGVEAGAAYIFQRDEGGQDNWGEVTKLTASDAQAGDLFGIRVALSGDTVVVGAWLEDTPFANVGAAYVFERNEGGADNWGEVTKLSASDASANDNLGIGVAISGDRAVVGAFGEDAGGNAAGAAYVFQRNEGGADNWGEVRKLTASDAQSGDNFGIRVAVSGDTAVLGAVREDAEGENAGAAYVFDLLQAKPTHTATSTSTATPTITPTPPPPIGGIALDSDLRALPLETAGRGGAPWAIEVWIVAAASLVAAGVAAWYARRRRRFA